MALDPDLVRIDLLRCKRLLFLSFPEGSKEREDFIVASKLSELGYLSRLVPEETAAMVYAEYNKRIKDELIYIISCLGIGLCLSLALFGFHQLRPNILWLKGFSFPFGFGAYFAGTHVFHMIDQWRKMKPFRKEHKELQIRIEKLKNEIKDSY